jgi:hypothetical protein
MNTCETCRHFAALPKECRAKSPQPVMIQGPMGQPAVLGVFPATKSDNWCGEWQPSIVS